MPGTGLGCAATVLRGVQEMSGTEISHDTTVVRLLPMRYPVLSKGMLLPEMGEALRESTGLQHLNLAGTSLPCTGIAYGSTILAVLT